ncbi:hypothetical protein N7509_010024 [Penicillium cosmopolitanum]|uniref:Uncharacterized protein n=1 Tax=Penicillium cosmopolitanum TaxID=1131564 RepID=A0A9X0B456_9EURO|nr:uncharacterized protein N7509_010024 [Penicillium cosmopolitanum]KAJ5387483.1 hypothetical protein N7509_010024 [Penicillium cosmopolitanum]
MEDFLTKIAVICLSYKSKDKSRLIKLTGLNGSKRETIGRTSEVEDLNFDISGKDFYASSYVAVDKYSNTSVDGIHVLGDVDNLMYSVVVLAVDRILAYCIVGPLRISPLGSYMTISQPSSSCTPRLALSAFPGLLVAGYLQKIIQLSDAPNIIPP